MIFSPFTCRSRGRDDCVKAAKAAGTPHRAISDLRAMQIIDCCRQHKPAMSSVQIKQDPAKVPAEVMLLLVIFVCLFLSTCLIPGICGLHMSIYTHNLRVITCPHNIYIYIHKYNINIQDYTRIHLPCSSPKFKKGNSIDMFQAFHLDPKSCILLALLVVLL